MSAPRSRCTICSSRWRKSGIAVIAISSELPEILAISDRIVTMREGRVTGEIARDEATEEILMTMMTLQREGGVSLRREGLMAEANPARRRGGGQDRPVSASWPASRR